MRHNLMATLAALLTVLTSFGTGCQSSTEAPAPAPNPDPGSIRVTVTSFGLRLDPDGYELAVGAQQLQRIDRFAELSIADLPPGDYDVLISGLDEGQGCRVWGENPRRITVASGEEAKVRIIVDCGPHDSDF
jgi:hypothetical protein